MHADVRFVLGVYDPDQLQVLHDFILFIQVAPLRHTVSFTGETIS